MIRYTLKCDQNHSFDGWFASAEAFDRLRAAAMVGCTFCGSTQVEKALMAPAVRPARRAMGAPDSPPDSAPAEAARPDTTAPARSDAAPPSAGEGATARGGTGPAPLSHPQNPVEQALAALRRAVEENSDYVGPDFAAEARAIHDGSAPERAIHGEANPEEARALIEDGIPVTPLPFFSKRSSN